MLTDAPRAYKCIDWSYIVGVAEILTTNRSIRTNRVTRGMSEQFGLPVVDSFDSASRFFSCLRDFGDLPDELLRNLADQCVNDGAFAIGVPQDVSGV